MGLTAVQLHRHVLSLLARGFHIDTKDNRGRTALMHVVSASFEDASTTEILLKTNADIYAVDVEGSNALGLVIEKSHKWLAMLPPEPRHLKILTMFFERVRNDFFTNRELTVQRLRDARCPMALVPFVQDVSIIKYIYQNARDFIQYDRSLTILHGPVLAEDLVTVEILIHFCANLNDTTTALFAYNVNSLDNHEKIQILTTLLDFGAYLYVPQRGDLTPIKYLLKYGRIQTRLTVLEYISPEKCKYHKVAALHYLLENQRNDQKISEEMNILLSRGFDVNIRNEEGINALTFAVKQWYGVHHLLTRYGAEVNWTEIVEETSILECLTSFDKKRQDYYQEVVDSILQYQFGIDIHHLFEILNEDVAGEINDFFYMQIVISNYAISELTLDYSITKYIPMNDLLTKHFNFCQEKIKQLKRVRLCDSVTLYQLLTVNDDDIDRYMCQSNFVSELKNLINRETFENFYYIIIIRKRIENAMKIKKLRKKACLFISQLTGLNRYGVGEDHYVVYKIVNYLSRQDILNLFGGQLAVHHGNQVPTPDIIPWVSENWLTRTFKKLFL